MDHARKFKFSSYVLFAIYKQNVLILFRLSDTVQCRKGLDFRTWALYLSFRIILFSHVETQLNIVALG